MLPVVHWITRRGRSTVVIGSNLHVRSAVDAHLGSGDEIGADEPSIATTAATASGLANITPPLSGSTEVILPNSEKSASAGSPGPMLCLDSPVPSVIPEEMEPGCTELNLILSLANSSASACVIALM